MIWNLTIMLKGREQPVMLNFKGGDAAKAARDRFWAAAERVGPIIDLTDDFGATVTVWLSDVLALLVHDIDGTFEAQAEQALMQAKAQAKVNRKAQADPLLRVQSGNGMVLNH